ncbi:PepSY domain-containing protein [Flavobacterium sp. SORGH_AS_0622]|uniref:PepSY-associated TM helix domain-containing protein n=1 Tax=Flavobacterium sp. SORGH_AS_0622 TaxID=3041772 RepID=UPI002782AF5D|nr:PepSY-associated TM helix domain-containing protein [Flavobacterium sp. SORGH_AS_0622]MDQ1165598.1 putative iron-regulated membrane protein [Flavobacterium sp. SORGH_AS_0622]
MNKTFKKNIGFLHLWLGLASGLIVFIVALTGSILVFEKEIDTFVNPEFYEVSSIGTKKLPVDLYVNAIRKKYAITELERIQTYQDPKRTVIISGTDADKNEQIFSVDPYTGKVLGQTTEKSRFFSVVLDLHRHLILGEAGKFITGCSCLIFVFLLISGLILWWPKKMKNLKQRLTVKWSASFKRVNWDFHSTFGFYSFLFLLTISLTGLTWSFKWFESGIYLFADGTIKKPSAKVENPTKVDPKLDKTYFYQNIFSKTDSIYKYTGDTQIRIPSDTINSIMVIKLNIEKSIPNISSMAYFDKYTGELLKIKSYESFSNGDKVRRLIYPIHTGSIYGYPTKILAFLVCLFAATLPITGLLIWLGKKKKK